MKSARVLYSLNDIPTGMFSYIPNEIYANIIRALYNKFSNDFADLKSLLNLNCASKLLNKKFNFITNELWDLVTKYIRYDPNGNLSKIICEAQLIQAVNNSTEKVTVLLNAGIALTDRIATIINSYDASVATRQLSAWKILKSQVSLWKLPFAENINSSNFLAAFNSCFNDKNISLNCRNELGLTFIEWLAMNNLSYTQALLQYSQAKKPHDKAIETDILRLQINGSKELILAKVASDTIRKENIDYNNSTEILAGQELLFEALEANNTKQLRKLLELGINFTQDNIINAKSECRFILEEQRAKNSKLFNVKTIEEVKEALQKSAQINSIDKQGYTPLYFAIHKGSIEVVELLLDRGAQVNAMGNSGRTPLHVAAYCGHVEVVKLLLDRGAQINAMGNSERTPLYFAIRKGSIEVVKLLLDRDARIDITDDSGRTPLHCAAYRDHIKIIELLLDRDAQINVTDDFGCTPLHWAAYRNCIEIVKLLISEGAKVGKEDIDSAGGEVKSLLITQYQIQQYKSNDVGSEKSNRSR